MKRKNLLSLREIHLNGYRDYSENDVENIKKIAYLFVHWEFLLKIYEVEDLYPKSNFAGSSSGSKSYEKKRFCLNACSVIKKNADETVSLKNSGTATTL